MKNSKYLIAIVTLAVCLIGATAMAGGLKNRMKQRAPAIATLKAQGIVGENRVGFIEFRSAPQQENLVRTENADRKTIYTAIAKKRGVSVEKVGKTRAEVLAQKAPAGTWLQKDNGKWYQK